MRVSKLYILLWIYLYYILTPLLPVALGRDFGRWEYEPDGLPENRSYKDPISHSTVTAAV